MEHLELTVKLLVTDKASSFDDLFRAEYPSVYRAVLRLVGDNGRAEEIGAEVFVKLLTRPLLLGSDHIAAWLHRSALNAALDDLRRQRTSNEVQILSSIKEVVAPNPHEIFERSERVRQVRAVLSTMRSRDVRLLIAKTMDLSYERIAAITGIKRKSVGTLLTRAQSTFEQKYRRKYGSD